LLLGLAGLVSALAGLVLVGIGIITRQERAVSAGKRRFHGSAFERRWIPDPDERERHAEIVADRLELAEPESDGHVALAAAANRLGISVTTVRRRITRGELEGVYTQERLVGVRLPAE
jgi:DNA invertase Pin-like site-specific DNA recombinase